VLHPADGHVLQVYCGIETWEPLRVGDQVKWKPDFYSPGDWPNDVYESNREDGSDDDFVVIKDFCISQVLRPPLRPGGSPLGLYHPANWKDEEPDENGPCVYDVLRRDMGLGQPSRELWPDLAWERVRREKEQAERELEERKQQFLQEWREGKHFGKHFGFFVAEPQGKESEKVSPSEVEVLNERLFDKLCGAERRLETEEDAIRYFMATDSVNSFTRAKMREPGFMRLIFTPWKELPELAQQIERPVNLKMAGWDWHERPIVRELSQRLKFDPLDMARQAAEYWGKQVLKEAGQWGGHMSVCGTWCGDHWTFRVSKYPGES
jgi:hypothetical protein